MAVNWTRNQQSIIDFKKGNLLVAAGAGSGKTAVLTAHIVKRITKAENPVDLDTLLVVTFTNAAAAEMKERVRKNLEDMLAQNPADENLSRQIGLIPSANISTIHRFCLKLIREQFFRLNLDPGFRLGDTGELSLMRADILEELFEEMYEAREQDFLTLRDMYGGKQSDDNLTELVLKLYEYAQSYPDPDEWLKKSLGDDDAWTNELFNVVHNRIVDLTKTMGDVVDFARNEHIPPRLIDVLQDDESGLKLLCDLKDLEGLCLAIGEFKFTKKPPLRKDEKEEYAGTEGSVDIAFKELREAVKKSLMKLQKDYAGYSARRVKKEEQETLNIRAELVKIVRMFSERFAQRKRSLGVCDFSDLEHMALSILYEEGKPTQVADSYAMSFTEILTDEYQDCNLVQEAILYAVSRERFGEENRFMVGDVKQSIYGFRQARPELFLEKYKSYSDEEDARTRKVELADNFRSRSGVLSGINLLFSQIMTEKLGGIAYDEKAALKAGASYPEKGDSPDMELLLLDIGDEEDISTDDNDTDDEEEIDTSGYNKFEYEARMVGERIIGLVNPGNPCMVYDKNLDCMRPAAFKDIVILMRSLSSTQENYMRVLKEMGIPVYVENESGYFSSIEVVDVLNYLRVLDNPMQDIPLAGVMRSAFGGFSAEELAEIRLTGKGKGQDSSFYACLLAARDGNPKLDKFMTGMESYRRLSRFIPIHELLARIIEETGYRYYVGALPQGKKRLLNLDVLVAKARSYEETSFRGLFHFIRYIDRLRKYDYEMDVSAGGDEEIDAVRIMTIHKSKGLEFPIVFICNMNGQFNQMDLRAPVLLDSDYGIASDVRNAKYRFKSKTVKKAAVCEKQKLSLLEEEMRVLYVAMTRAKEKLIMTGNDKKLAKKMDGWRQTSESVEDELSFTQLSGAMSYLDWVVPAFLHAQSLGPCDVSFSFNTKKKDELSSAKVFVPDIPDSEYDDLPRKLKNIIDWTYPYEDLMNVHAAMSVSEIKKAAYESEEVVSLIDVATEDEKSGSVSESGGVKKGAKGATGADRGTAFHRALQLCRFEAYPVEGSFDERHGFVQSEMKRIRERGLLKEEDAKLVDARKIEEFFETDIARRMCLAAREEKLHKEEPFVMGVSVNEIYKDLPTSPRQVLVRGIIDAYFEEDGELVIVDYKTDRVGEADGEEILKNRYSVQLHYYKKALNAALKNKGKRVKQTYLYSFALRKEIEVFS